MNNCTHNFEEIRRIRDRGHGGGPDDVIYWCTKCGALNITTEADMKVIPEYSKPIRYPKNSSS